MHFSNSAFYLIYKFPRKEQKHVLKHILILFKHKTCIVMFFPKYIFQTFYNLWLFCWWSRPVQYCDVINLWPDLATSDVILSYDRLHTQYFRCWMGDLHTHYRVGVRVRRNRCATSIRQHPPDTPHLRGKRNDSSDSDCKTKKNHSELLNEQPVRRVNTSSSIVSLRKL